GQGRPRGRPRGAARRRPDPGRGRGHVHRLRHAPRGRRGRPRRRPAAPARDARRDRDGGRVMSQPAFKRDDYTDFCEGVRRLTGIDLGQYKRPQMERRIRTFAESRGATSLPDYLRRLSDDRAQLESFLDRMTINVSQLWRNPEQWERLAAAVLPELATTGQIRVWSAGCSYGAEAYTI